MPNDTFYASGHEGQPVAVFPIHGLVIARPGMSQFGNWNDESFFQDIIAAFQETLPMQIPELELSQEQQWRLLSLTSAVATALGVRSGIKLYRLLQDEDPPLDPFRQDGDWSNALLFGIASGATVGLSRIVTRAVAREVLRERHPLRQWLNG